MQFIKFIKTPPKVLDLLGHDGPVLRILQGGLYVFILISSITVFFGVHSYVSDYLDQQPWLIGRLGYLVAYFALSLTPDLLCSLFFAHIVRALLRNQYQDRLSMILLIAFTILVGFLSVYSWTMSRSSAVSLAYDFTPEVKVENTARFDSLSQNERGQLRQAYETDVEEINNRYDQLLLVQTKPLEQAALPFRQQIQSLEASRSEQNTNWIDLQIAAVNKKLLPIEQSISEVQTKNENRRRGEILQRKKKYQKDIEFLNNRLYENRQASQQRNQKTTSRIDQLSAVFTREFKKIAGFAIIIVILLTGLLEVLFHRNGIDRQATVLQWHPRLSGLFEVAYLPFVFIGRHTLNRVRRQYEKMPPLLPEPSYKRAFRHGLHQVNTPANPAFAVDTEENTDHCESKQVSTNVFDPPVASVPAANPGEQSVNGKPVPHDMRGSDLSADFLAMLNQLAREVNFISQQIFTTCAHPNCENKFIPKNHRHKYCCTDHRMDDWEQQNDQKLNFKS